MPCEGLLEFDVLFCLVLTILLLSRYKGLNFKVNNILQTSRSLLRPGSTIASSVHSMFKC